MSITEKELNPDNRRGHHNTERRPDSIDRIDRKSASACSWGQATVALAWQDYWKIRTLDLMAGGMSVRFLANPPLLGKPFTFTVTEDGRRVTECPG